MGAGGGLGLGAGGGLGLGAGGGLGLGAGGAGGLGVGVGAGGAGGVGVGGGAGGAGGVGVGAGGTGGLGPGGEGVRPQLNMQTMPRSLQPMTQSGRSMPLRTRRHLKAQPRTFVKHPITHCIVPSSSGSAMPVVKETSAA